jgi:hypothetical protein
MFVVTLLAVAPPASACRGGSRQAWLAWVGRCACIDWTSILAASTGECRGQAAHVVTVAVVAYSSAILLAQHAGEPRQQLSQGSRAVDYFIHQRHTYKELTGCALVLMRC